MTRRARVLFDRLAELYKLNPKWPSKLFIYSGYVVAGGEPSNRSPPEGTRSWWRVTEYKRSRHIEKKQNIEFQELLFWIISKSVPPLFFKAKSVFQSSPSTEILPHIYIYFRTFAPRAKTKIRISSCDENNTLKYYIVFEPFSVHFPASSFLCKHIEHNAALRVIVFTVTLDPSFSFHSWCKTFNIYIYLYVATFLWKESSRKLI